MIHNLPLTTGCHGILGVGVTRCCMWTCLFCFFVHSKVFSTKNVHLIIPGSPHSFSDFHSIHTWNAGESGNEANHSNNAAWTCCWQTTAVNPQWLPHSLSQTTCTPGQHWIDLTAPTPVPSMAPTQMPLTDQKLPKTISTSRTFSQSLVPQGEEG